MDGLSVPSVRRLDGVRHERTDGRRDALPPRTYDGHHDRRRHAVSTSLRLVDRVKTRTAERIDVWNRIWFILALICDIWWQ